jgi:hypothetical protein
VLPQFRHYLQREPEQTKPVAVLFCKKARHLPEEGFQPMRKIILAAALATSALGLAACSQKAENETSEAVEAMAADAEAATDAAAEGAEAAADASAEGVEAAADKAAEAAEAAADKAADTTAQ